MKLSQLLSEIGPYSLAGSPETEVCSLAYSSRQVAAGGLFVAVRGLKTDGHLYIGAALSRGAVVVVSEEDVEEVRAAGAALVRVPDSRAALARLSCTYHGHPARELKLVGITGTNGKTTTSYLVESVLREAGARVGVIGTINYRFGGASRPALQTTPESLDLQRLLREMADAGTTHVVMEVSSHALDLKRVDGCVFDVVVFTNLTRDHLDYHQDMERYFTAKRRLAVEMLSTEKNSEGKAGLAVVNLADPWGERFRQAAGSAISFGTDEADVRVTTFSAGLGGMEATLATPAGTLAVRSPLIGRHNLENIMAAVGAGLALGLEPETIERGVAGLRLVPGRLQPVPNRAGIHVLVDYAHTDDALAHALGALRQAGATRLTCLFGCGGDRDRGKRPLMGREAGKLADFVVVTSDNPRTEDPEAIIADITPGLEAVRCRRREPENRAGGRGYTVVADRAEAIGLAIRQAAPGEVVLIAGKGHEDYQIVGQTRRHFDDAEIAAAVLDGLEVAA
ncbi:MAG: UDP-N-acetylmuramoyl-L-alanyl-D-glutamate--2,6-diaminopimelate ligase [Pseudomonadota bacterium]